MTTVHKVDDVEGILPQLKAENVACSSVDTKHLTADLKCTKVLPVHNKLNNLKIEKQFPDTNTHNNKLTSPLTTSKSDTYISIPAREHYQFIHKSDTHIHNITPEQHLIDIPKHTPTEDERDTAITEMTASSDSFHSIAAKYDDDDDDDGGGGSLDELVSTNLRYSKDSDINLDKMVQNNTPEDNGKKENLKTMTPAISVESLDQLAARYEDTDVDLDELVKINLPYCDNEDTDINMLVAINISNQCDSEAVNRKNVKTLIDLFDKSL